MRSAAARTGGPLRLCAMAVHFRRQRWPKTSAWGVRDRGPPGVSSLPQRRSRLNSRVVVISVAVIATADFLLWRWEGPPFVFLALLDEPAHAATGLVALSGLGVIFEVPIVLAVLAGSVVIDLDHAPDMLGSHLLLVGHGIQTRPCTHSLTTVVVLASVALLVRGYARNLVLVAALALVVHFFRDIAEPGGSGAPLLWPLSDRVYTLGYGWYAGALIVLAAIALWIRTRHPKAEQTDPHGAA